MTNQVEVESFEIYKFCIEFTTKKVLRKKLVEFSIGDVENDYKYSVASVTGHRQLHRE